MRLAVIPARGGSKRIPRKNIKVFAGKPMIVWSLETARESGCFDKIIVSTDDKEIAQIARDSGAEVPFMRPAGLSDDHTPTVPVISHAINWCTANGGAPSEVCCVYATAPFLRGSDIAAGLELLTKSGADYTFGVTSYAFPIQRALSRGPDGTVAMIAPQHDQARSQDLEDAYHDVGQFYWGRSQAWLAGKPILSGSAASVLIPRARAQDIDTPEDWAQAEAMFKALQSIDVR